MKLTASQIQIIKASLSSENLQLLSICSTNSTISSECFFILLLKDSRLSPTFLNICNIKYINTVNQYVHKFCVGLSQDLNDIHVSNEFSTLLNFINTFCNNYKPDASILKDYITYQCITNTSLSCYNIAQSFSEPVSIVSVKKELERLLLTFTKTVLSPNIIPFGYFMTSPINYKLYSCISRDKEIEHCVDTLCRKTKNNALLIGLPGVGKTTIVEGLCNLLTSDTCPKCLQGYSIFSLSIPKLIAGSKYRGDLEERVTQLFEELLHVPKLIIFMDEIHQLVGTGSYEVPTSSLSDILKPYLTGEHIRIIGATTTDEFRKLEFDKALERRFSVIQIREPTKQQTLTILENVKDTYSEFHEVDIPSNMLDLIVKYSYKFDTHRHFPDKALDLLDNCCVRVKNHKKSKIITEQDITDVIYRNTGIPVTNINLAPLNFNNEMSTVISNTIIGQDHAVALLVNTLKRNLVGLSSDTKPVGSFLFVGPTGVGKTELCKQLASLYYKEDSFIKIDMSEYLESSSISKLIGSSPGYIGYEQGGLLTEHVKHHPYSVILFDEIEKAHPDVMNILLQILDEGVLTDNKGFKANFKNCIIILTSNVGSEEVTNQKLIGFMPHNGNNTHLWETTVKTKFKPEFLNRLDEIVYFNYLTENHIKNIVQLNLNKLKNKLNTHNIIFTISSVAFEKLCLLCYSKEYGARYVNRTISKEIETIITDVLLSNSTPSNIEIDCVNNSFIANCF